MILGDPSGHIRKSRARRVSAKPTQFRPGETKYDGDLVVAEQFDWRLGRKMNPSSLQVCSRDGPIERGRLEELDEPDIPARELAPALGIAAHHLVQGREPELSP